MQWFELWASARGSGSRGAFESLSITIPLEHWPTDGELEQAFAQQGYEIVCIIGMAPTTNPGKERSKLPRGGIDV